MTSKQDIAQIAARINLGTWIASERQYADEKFGDREMERRWLVEDGFSGEWETMVMNCLSRVKLHGLDTLAGRQAAGKAIVTLLAMTEGAIQLFGPMPEPGLPSGTVEDWVRD